MAKKTNGEASTVEHGGKQFRRAAGGMLPFWSPQDEKSGHPLAISGVTSNFRSVKGSEGKRSWENPAFDVVDPETGTAFTVICNESLQCQVEAEKLGDGETVLVKFEGMGKKKKGMNPPKIFTLLVEV